MSVIRHKGKSQSRAGGSGQSLMDVSIKIVHHGHMGLDETMSAVGKVAHIVRFNCLATGRLWIRRAISSAGRLASSFGSILCSPPP